MSVFTTHVSNGFFWRSYFKTDNDFTSTFDMQVTPPIDDTFDFSMITDLNATEYLMTSVKRENNIALDVFIS